MLVHGGYADSSCWNQTLSYLQGWDYATICGANPLRGIPTDAPYIASLLDSITGPVVLVGHSMGGTVTTNAAAGKGNVKALVYIAAFFRTAVGRSAITCTSYAVPAMGS